MEEIQNNSACYPQGQCMQTESDPMGSTEEDRQTDRQTEMETSRQTKSKHELKQQQKANEFCLLCAAAMHANGK